jgi:CheY-like chemotaxis protein
MSTLSVPCYFFPTNVVFVDDNQSFLNSVSLALSATLPYKTFIDPKQAITFLKNNARQSVNVESAVFVSSGNISGAASQGVELDLLPLQKRAYEQSRFNETSVVVVDYAMPTMNGLEFCRQLSDAGIRCKKLMLTGEADHSTAVDGFNKHIIDKFILKSDISTNVEMLNVIIADLQKQYFQEKSARILQYLLLDPLAPFVSESFVALFDSICHQYGVVEYYLFDTSGSFMLLTAEGKPIWFLVKNKEDKEMYCAMAEEAAVNAETFDALKAGRVIPFYPDGVFNLPSDDAWNDACLIPAKKLMCGNEELYYGVVERLAAESIKLDQIQSFNSYMSLLDAEE